MFTPDPNLVEQVDAAMQSWQPGDLALEERWFVHVGDGGRPLTVSTSSSTTDGVQAIMTETDGLMVVSQTCDIRRTSRERPYVEIAPLIRAEFEVVRVVMTGRRPRYATLPCLEPSLLVVDLDRTLTVEKSVAAQWKRTPGCSCDRDRRRLEQALIRKRARVAFPDDFTAMARKLLKRLSDKHDRATDEGRALRALREIRVQAQPSWHAPSVSLVLWFIRSNDDPTFEGRDWNDFLVEWRTLVQPTGRYVSIQSRLVSPRRMNVEDYLNSDILDLDHLSA